MDVAEFLTTPGIILDVRSPSEYHHAHIPHSLAFPLFTDEERALVGTLYKKEGKEKAFDQGLSMVAPKLVSFIQKARELASHSQTLLKITCARGGMRSASMEWLLKTAGLSTMRLEGGYKAFRQFILARFEKRYPFVVLGGLTGSGKTDILRALKERGAQVLDLEAMARHRGSSFGANGVQPTSEHFENEMGGELYGYSKERPIFVEDESRLVGQCKIPDLLFDQIRAAPLIMIHSPKEERISRILQEYGTEEENKLIEATKRIEKRLGAVECRRAIESIRQKDLRSAIEITLNYYDKAYAWMLENRDTPFFTVGEENMQPVNVAEVILSRVTPI